ncbi:hypothetical protein HDU86_005768 [Geranomyces michiganensis]|nr:hypothetical protein HDU86_005768 [Geranomyces michiganensis]
MARYDTHVAACKAVLAFELLLATVVAICSANIIRRRGLQRLNLALCLLSLMSLLWVALLVPQTLAQLDAVRLREDVIFANGNSGVVVAAEDDDDDDGGRGGGPTAEERQLELELVVARSLRFANIKAVVFTLEISLVLIRFETARSSISMPKWASYVVMAIAIVLHLLVLSLFIYFLIQAPQDNRAAELGQIACAVLALFTQCVDNLLSWSFLRSVRALSACLGSDIMTGWSRKDVSAPAAAAGEEKGASTWSLFLAGRRRNKSAASSAPQSSSREVVGDTDTSVRFLFPLTISSAPPRKSAAKHSASVSSLSLSLPSSPHSPPRTSVSTAICPSMPISPDCYSPDSSSSSPTTIFSFPTISGNTKRSPQQHLTYRSTPTSPTTPPKKRPRWTSPTQTPPTQPNNTSPPPLHQALQAGRRAHLLLLALCGISFSNLLVYAAQLFVVAKDPYWGITLHVVASAGPVLQMACFMGFTVVVRLFLEVAQ